MGLEERKKPFEPLIPSVEFIEFNSYEEINKIDEYTSCIVLETIQGSAGFIKPKVDYLNKVKKRCDKVGALLILDEIQTGKFGRDWILECKSGQLNFKAEKRIQNEKKIEIVGEKLRSMMPWITSNKLVNKNKN